MKKKIVKGFRLSELGLSLLKKIAEYEDLTETAVIENLIREKSKKLKLYKKDSWITGVVHSFLL